MKTKSLTPELIKELSAVKEAPCISLYMPTHRVHPENAQDPIRYKNLVKQVKESLTEKYPTAERETMIENFEALISDHDFWNHTLDGLCVLGSSELFEVIHLQLPVEELVMVADSFHTKPLRNILQSGDRYQVLALTMDEMHLYEGNRHSLFEIELSAEPQMITESSGQELAEKHPTQSSYGGVAVGSSTTHHGQVGKKDVVDNDSESYFRQVASDVYDRCSKASGLPLLLAALPEHHSLFNQVNKNPFLLPNGIEINPKSVSKEKLAELSWQVMEPVYIKKLEGLAEKFSQAKANGLGSDNLEEVNEAAEASRVDTLFIEAHRVIAKRLRNKVTGTFETADLTQPVLDDELDGVGELVSKMGGTVFIIPKEQMPTDTGLAAIYRY